jgi:hypothetical protein
MPAPDGRCAVETASREAMRVRVRRSVRRLEQQAAARSISARACKMVPVARRMNAQERHLFTPQRVERASETLRHVKATPRHLKSCRVRGLENFS